MQSRQILLFLLFPFLATYAFEDWQNRENCCCHDWFQVMDPSGLYANCQAARQQDFEHECHESRPQHTKEVLEQRLHEKNQKGWRRIALNFTPS